MGINRKKTGKSRKSYPQAVGAGFQSYPQLAESEMQDLLQAFSTGKVLLGILWKAGVECVEKLGRKKSRIFQV